MRLLKIMSVVVGVLVALWGVVAAGPSQAATLVVTIGGVTGIDDLFVGNTIYDVTFVNDSYNNVYASTPPTFLGDPTDAAQATTAIATTLNSLSVALVVGGATLILVPFDDNAIFNTFSWSQSQSGVWSPPQPAFTLNNSYVQGDPGGVYAVFAPAPGPIAGAGLPGLMMFNCGVVLVWWRRKRKAAFAA
jgi:hypothetical protein